jgi:hypothetical protein
MNTKCLKGVKNLAVGEGVTASYMYELVQEGKMKLIMIDGVKFFDTQIYPTPPLQIEKSYFFT